MRILAGATNGDPMHSLTGVSLCSSEPKAYDADQDSECCAGRKCWRSPGMSAGYDSRGLGESSTGRPDVGEDLHHGVCLV